MPVREIFLFVFQNTNIWFEDPADGGRFAAHIGERTFLVDPARMNEYEIEFQGELKRFPMNAAGQQDLVWYLATRGGIVDGWLDQDEVASIEELRVFGESLDLFRSLPSSALKAGSSTGKRVVRLRP